MPQDSGNRGRGRGRDQGRGTGRSFGRGRGRDSGRGRGRDSGRGCGRDSGRGRGGDSGRGRGRSDAGRGRGGRPGRGPPPCPKTVLSNLLPCAITPNFKFYQYSVDCKDKRGKLIDSRSRRFTLFNFGLFDERVGWIRRASSLNGKQAAELRRVVFFQGSYVLSARPLPGLEEFPPNGVALVGVGDAPASDEGDLVVITSVQAFCAPLEMMTQSSASSVDQLAASMGALTVDLRCANCTKSFLSKQDLINHCKDVAGHFPVASREGEDLRPANKEEFIQYANVVLRRALSDRLAKWGREYIDPKSFTEPEDRNGRPLGVRVFRAFSCEFGWNKATPEPSTPLELVLTVDLRAKIMRTKSLLDLLCDGRSQPGQPGPVRFKPNEQAKLKRDWKGEVVIATYDKRCYSVVDLLFDKSPATLLVDGLNISHAEYFAKRKKITLKHPTAGPMVAVNGRNNSRIYLPAELVAGNELDAHLKMKLPMIASFTPKDRLQGIEEVKRFLTPGAQKTKGSGLLPALGFRLSDKLIKVGVTKLELPVITVAGVKVPEHSGGMWAPLIAKANYNANPKFAVQLKVILIAHKSLRDADKVYNRVRDMVNNQNSSYRFGNEPHSVVKVGDGAQHYGAVERHFSEGAKLPSNVFVLDFCRPPRGSSTDPAYSVVKSMLGKGGHVSQFVNWSTYDHSNPRDFKRSNIILSGVARQILAKCGVRIWFVNIPKNIPLPAVFVGVDVFHAPRKYDEASGKRKAKESVAAVIVQIARSHTPNPNDKVEIYCETESRSAGKEMELGLIMNRAVSNALKAFNVIPACSFVWRDGVGDSTVSQVAAQEIPKVREALLSTDGVVGASRRREDIPLSYIVCQKRINTKLLGEGGTSVPAGALVIGLQGAEHKTFYINGTSPPYSTAKPCRFIVAQRDQQLTGVSPSQLSWALCHDYANWTGPIKLPSVVQMAHKLAELTGGMADNGRSIDYKKYAGKVFFL